MANEVDKRSLQKTDAVSKATRERAAAAAKTAALAKQLKAKLPTAAPASRVAIAGATGQSGFDLAPAPSAPSAHRNDITPKVTKEKVDQTSGKIGLGAATPVSITEKKGTKSSVKTATSELTESLTAEKGFKLTEDGMKASYKLSQGLDFETKKGWGISSKVEASASASGSVTETDGVTSFTLKGEASAKAEAGVATPIGGASASGGTGANASLSVSMPTDAYKALAKDPSKFNPLDPNTYPPGTKVELAASTFVESELSASLGVGGPVSLNGSTSTKATEGKSLEIEKLADGKVRLTEGPTEAFERGNSLGVDAGVAKASVTRTDELSGQTLKSAEFDLNTEQGRKAFNAALLSGQVPSKAGPGVQNPKTVERIAYDSSAELEASLGILDMKGSLGSNSAEKTITTNADGTKDVAATVQYEGGPKLTIDQKFDAAGKELEGERTYSFEVTPDQSEAAMYNRLLSGDPSAKTGPIKAGEPVTLSFTTKQLEALQGRLAQAPGQSSPWLSRDPATNQYEKLAPGDFAMAIARHKSGASGLAAELNMKLVALPVVAHTPVAPLDVSIKP